MRTSNWEAQPDVLLPIAGSLSVVQNQESQWNKQREIARDNDGSWEEIQRNEDDDNEKCGNEVEIMHRNRI